MPFQAVQFANNGRHEDTDLGSRMFAVGVPMHSKFLVENASASLSRTRDSSKKVSNRPAILSEESADITIPSSKKDQS
jgi:hypothetical protein